MKLLKALKRVAQRETEKIEIEEKQLKETKDVLMTALEQGRNASKSLKENDKILKGLYWSGWRINGVESYSYVSGQTLASVRFMGIYKNIRRHWKPFEYEETITNPQELLGDIQKIVAEVKKRIGGFGEWYPIILQNHPFYRNYFEERIK